MTKVVGAQKSEVMLSKFSVSSSISFGMGFVTVGAINRAIDQMRLTKALCKNLMDVDSIQLETGLMSCRCFELESPTNKQLQVGVLS